MQSEQFPADRVFIGSNIYRGSSYGPWHPLKIPRVSTVIDLCRALGWLPTELYMTSPQAKPAALAKWHEPAYVQAVVEAERTQTISPEDRERFGLGTVSNPIFPEMFRRPATAAGGSILAGELLSKGGQVFNPGGGTHHGLPGRANGFCYFNDPVLAILSLRRNGMQRIAYVDIDAHHPDGVEHGFAQDPDVLMISTHEAGRWPRTGAMDNEGCGQVFNLPVPKGFNDSEMAHGRDHLIGPALEAFGPDAVVFQCGADGLLEDPQSALSLSNRAHLGVLGAIQDRTDRLLVLGGGGYNPWSVARCWTALWGVICGQEIPSKLPASAAKVLGALTWDRPGRPRETALSLTETLLDAPREGPIRDEVKAGVRHLACRLPVLPARGRLGPPRG